MVEHVAVEISMDIPLKRIRMKCDKPLLVFVLGCRPRVTPVRFWVRGFYNYIL